MAAANWRQRGVQTRDGQGRSGHRRGRELIRHGTTSNPGVRECYGSEEVSRSVPGTESGNGSPRQEGKEKQKGKL
jgi:hypothetical protein